MKETNCDFKKFKNKIKPNQNLKLDYNDKNLNILSDQSNQASSFDSKTNEIKCKNVSIENSNYIFIKFYLFNQISQVLCNIKNDVLNKIINTDFKFFTY